MLSQSMSVLLATITACKVYSPQLTNALASREPDPTHSRPFLCDVTHGRHHGYKWPADKWDLVHEHMAPVQHTSSQHEYPGISRNIQEYPGISSDYYHHLLPFVTNMNTAIVMLLYHNSCIMH